jgi:hypothetical protein
MNGGWLRHYSWRCQPVDTSTTDFGMRVRFKNDEAFEFIEFETHGSKCKVY